jgi:hypothetical protein
MPSLRDCRGRRDSRKPASGKPGAVQFACRSWMSAPRSRYEAPCPKPRSSRPSRRYRRQEAPKPVRTAASVHRARTATEPGCGGRAACSSRCFGSGAGGDRRRCDPPDQGRGMRAALNHNALAFRRDRAKLRTRSAGRCERAAVAAMSARARWSLPLTVWVSKNEVPSAR